MAKNIPNDILQLADNLHSTAIHLLRQLRVEDRASGVGPAQLSALSVLVFGESMSLKRLAEIEQVKPPTMVRIVHGLVEQRLATSRADRDDARKIRISATDRGRTLMHRARLRRVKSLAQMLAAKTKVERSEIAAAVAILRNLRVKTA
ncbi:MAG TPA: MarR family transcriptional regulator [Candidatus Angelobacter sp.]|jgi:DNA-binding MarR family transcriptional regulator|nr:MarR family transcriptional regulator [Candidatus Angelobacter sp.]